MRDSAHGMEEVAQAIHEASTDIGFFYVTGHTVKQVVIDRTLETAKAFFALGAEQKNKVKVNRNHRGYIGFGSANMYGKNLPDLKESFKWAFELTQDDPEVMAGSTLLGPNRWPDFMPELRERTYIFYLELMLVAQQVLRVIAVSLDLPQGIFLQYYNKPLARGGILHYPPQEETSDEGQFDVAPHTDYGVLTVLWQDREGGLEVKNLDGDWISAPPIEGTFVINIGDLLQRWTNDRYVSNPHRVINRSGKERYSMVLFYDPDPSTVIDPSHLNLPDDIEPKHPPVTCGNYIKERFTEAFKY